MSQIKITDAHGHGIPYIPVRFSNGHETSEQAVYDNLSKDDGTQGWPIPNWPARDYTLHVNTGDYRNPAFASESRYVAKPGPDEEFSLEKTGEAQTPTGSLSRLVRIEGHRMVNERGEKVYGRGASAFLLFKKHLDGQDITPQLEQLRGLGCNLIRVMGMFESLGGFNPKPYGDRYYSEIVPFCAKCEAFGIYVLWTCCAATGAWMNDDEAITHVKRTVEELKKTVNAIGSPVNEQGQHNNSINLSRVKADVDWGWLLHDMGSYGSDIPCSPPFGTHAVLHVNRHYSNSVRDCCPLDNPNYVNDHLQVGIDEPDRYGDEGNTSVEQAGDAAGTAYAALFFVFHTMQGERADVLHGNTLDCATAAFAAMAR